MTSTDISITKAREEPGAASFRVEVPTERVQSTEKKVTERIAKQVRLPGFRKGKAPLAVVRRRYHDAIREEVLREVIGESWKTTLDREELKPIADPHIHDLRFEDGAPLTFELHVEIKPDLNLERLSGFSMTRQVKSVTDEAVEVQLDELRRQKAAWAPETEGRPRPGELVGVTLVTVDEGESAEPRQYQLVLGEGQAIPGVEELIMGLAPGETGEGDVRYPDDFPDEARRGQSRRVRVTLNERKRRDLPDLTDDFAREVGDFDSLGDLRAAIRRDLEAEARREADAMVRQQLIDQIVQANGLQAPRPVVQRMLSAYAQAYGIAEDRFQSFAEEFAPLAEAQVRRELVLEAVTESEGLAATEEDLDQRVAELAERRGITPGEFYASLQKAGRLKELERALTEEKVFAFLLSKSTVTEN